MQNKSKAVKSVKTESKTQPVEKTATKAENKKKLEKVPEAVVFWCHDGQVFRDVQGLLDGFDVMTDEIFDYHVNNDKNDFSCWVQDVVGDYKLAQDLKSVKNKAQAKKKVQQRYIELTQLEA